MGTNIKSLESEVQKKSEWGWREIKNKKSQDQNVLCLKWFLILMCNGRNQTAFVTKGFSEKLLLF